MGSTRGRRGSASDVQWIICDGSVESWNPGHLDDVITTNHHQTARIITSNGSEYKDDVALSGIRKKYGSGVYLYKSIIDRLKNGRHLECSSNSES